MGGQKVRWDKWKSVSYGCFRTTPCTTSYVLITDFAVRPLILIFFFFFDETTVNLVDFTQTLPNKYFSLKDTAFMSF